MTAPTDDDWTEATDADIPRADLVGKAANGSPGFLLMKQESGGLLDADTVRGLLAKADTDPVVRDDVTMTGSPGALMKMIHAAAERAKESPETLETPVTAAVAKADPVDADPAAIDLTDPLADSTDVLAESMPGSAAWEQLDADSAMKWTAVLARAKNALEVLSSRELMESDSPLGDGDDAGNAFDLEDACCAIDFAIGTLAAYAVGEQATSEQMDEMASMQKAAASLDTDALAVIEGYAPIVKAGRVLSAANESAIRGAVESLSNVLNTLPAPIPDAAPVAKSKEPAVSVPVETIEPTPVEKNDPVAEEIIPSTVETPVAPLAKAKGDPLTPVYDQSGKLVGMVDSTDLIPIATVAPADDAEPAAAEDAPADDATSAASPDDAAADATPPDATVADPATPDAATIPGTDTVQAPVDDTVAKAALTQVDALTEALTTVAKQFEAHTELADVVKGLQERLDHIAKMPDDRKSPRLNGATGTPGVAKRDDSTEDPFAALKKAMEEETDPIKKAAARNALIFAEIKDRFAHH